MIDNLIDNVIVASDFKKIKKLYGADGKTISKELCLILDTLHTIGSAKMVSYDVATLGPFLT